MRLSLGFALLQMPTLECPCCRMNGLGSADHDAENVAAAIVGRAGGYQTCAKCGRDVGEETARDRNYRARWRRAAKAVAQ